MISIHEILTYAALSVLTLSVAIVSVYVTAIVAAIRVAADAERYTINNKDPLSTPKAILRVLGPLDAVMVTFSGRYLYVAFNEGAAAWTVQGLMEPEKEPGMRSRRESDWARILLPDSEGEIPPTIQSRYGFWDPIYLFRYLVFRATGRHVVRLWFPFFVVGVWEILSPEQRPYVRARPKGLKRNAHMEVLEHGVDGNPDPSAHSGSAWMVSDTTDRIVVEDSHGVLTASFPNKSGYEFRSHIILQLLVVNFHRAYRIKALYERINATVSEAWGHYSRPGSLDTVYAADVRGTTRVQKLVEKYLTKAETKAFGFRVVRSENSQKQERQKLSLMEWAGLELVDVALADIVPADHDTEKAVQLLMRIVPEGVNKAQAARALLEGQIEALGTIKDPKLADALQRLVVAEKLGSAGNIDIIMNQAGGDPVRAVDAVLNKIQKNTK